MSEPDFDDASIEYEGGEVTIRARMEYRR
jgi:hypothetical protein